MCLLNKGCEGQEKKSEKSTCLCYFTLNLPVEGVHRAILYLLNPCAYIMHVAFNAGESVAVIREDHEDSVIGHVGM